MLPGQTNTTKIDNHNHNDFDNQCHTGVQEGLYPEPVQIGKKSSEVQLPKEYHNETYAEQAACSNDIQNQTETHQIQEKPGFGSDTAEQRDNVEGDDQIHQQLYDSQQQVISGPPEPDRQTINLNQIQDLEKHKSNEIYHDSTVTGPEQDQHQTEDTLDQTEQQCQNSKMKAMKATSNVKVNDNRNSDSENKTETQNYNKTNSLKSDSESDGKTGKSTFNQNLTVAELLETAQLDILNTDSVDTDTMIQEFLVEENFITNELKYLISHLETMLIQIQSRIELESQERSTQYDFQLIKQKLEKILHVLQYLEDTKIITAKPKADDNSDGTYNINVSDYYTQGKLINLARYLNICSDEDVIITRYMSRFNRIKIQKAVLEIIWEKLKFKKQSENKLEKLKKKDEHQSLPQFSIVIEQDPIIERLSSFWQPSDFQRIKDISECHECLQPCWYVIMRPSDFFYGVVVSFFTAISVFFLWGLSDVGPDHHNESDKSRDTNTISPFVALFCRVAGHMITMLVFVLSWAPTTFRTYVGESQQTEVYFIQLFVIGHLIFAFLIFAIPWGDQRQSQESDPEIESNSFFQEMAPNIGSVINLIYGSPFVGAIGFLLVKDEGQRGVSPSGPAAEIIGKILIELNNKMFIHLIPVVAALTVLAINLLNKSDNSVVLLNHALTVVAAMFLVVLEVIQLSELFSWYARSTASLADIEYNNVQSPKDFINRTSSDSISLESDNVNNNATSNVAVNPVGGSGVVGVSQEQQNQNHLMTSVPNLKQNENAKDKLEQQDSITYLSHKQQLIRYRFNKFSSLDATLFTQGILDCHFALSFFLYVLGGVVTGTKFMFGAISIILHESKKSEKSRNESDSSESDSESSDSDINYIYTMVIFGFLINVPLRTGWIAYYAQKMSISFNFSDLKRKITGKEKVSRIQNKIQNQNQVAVGKIDTNTSNSSRKAKFTINFQFAFLTKLARHPLLSLYQLHGKFLPSYAVFSTILGLPIARALSRLVINDTTELDKELPASYWIYFGVSLFMTAFEDYVVRYVVPLAGDSTDDTRTVTETQINRDNIPGKTVTKVTAQNINELNYANFNQNSHGADTVQTPKLIDSQSRSESSKSYTKFNGINIDNNMSPTNLNRRRTRNNTINSRKSNYSRVSLLTLDDQSLLGIGSDSKSYNRRDNFKKSIESTSQKYESDSWNVKSQARRRVTNSKF